MLVTGNLGFSRLVLVVTLLVFPVIWIVLRRKWRFAAARREEIKRLLVLAAEESARAELEATEQYGISSAVEFVQQQQPPLQNQCAVCFSPTTKFCSQCKAVRYCSGKCQIVHWRQGHKEECRPYTNFVKSSEGRPSTQKEFNQEGYVSYGDNYVVGGRKGDKQVETFSPDVLLSKDEDEGLTNDVSNASVTHLFQRDSELTSAYGKASFDASIRTSIDADGLRTNDGIPAKFETVHAKMDESRLPFPKKFSNLEKSSVKVGQDKPVSDGDASCSSSGWSVDGSNDSLSEPSTPSSSGFWEGTINSKRSTLDANDDSTKSSSSESVGDMMFGHGSSLGFTADLTKDNILPAPQTKRLTSDDVSTTSGTKKHVHEPVLSEKICKDNLKTRGLQVDTGGSAMVLNSREAKASPSNNYCAHPGASVEERIITKDDKVISRSSSLWSERSNKVGDDTIGSSHALRSQEVGSTSGKDFDSGSTFSSRRDTSQTAKLSKIGDDVHGATTSSSEFSTNSANARNGLKSTVLKVVDQLKPSKLSRQYPMGVDSETAEKYTVKGLFSYELFVKLYNWNKVEMQPCGLMNCGNSCYANAVLQCLAFTPPITAYLLQRLHSKTCQNNDWCFTCEFESLVLKAKEGSSPLSPIRILSHIEKIGSHLGYGREEDAHEFLRYAIDTMQSSCLKEATSKTWGSVNEETTLIGLTFGGYLRSKIKCMRCGGKSERHERMMDLTVEIDGDIYALEEALRKFTGTEILDGENKYKCSRCKSYEKAKKKLTIIEAPNVLTIALKRFQSGKFGKLSKSIQFPEILNMAPYMSSTSDMSPIYRLYGVVVHLDIMNASFSGHYVCYVKNIQNKWFKVDDSAVIAVELESVLTKGAYMLLYARCSPRAPKLLRNSMVPRDPRKVKSPSLKSRSHSKGSCDSYRTDHLNSHPSQGLYRDHHSFQRISSSLDDDSSSDNSSSIFSEACSCSTDSSTRDSTSTDDYFDQIFGDPGHNWNKSWWNSSDSDTSSSSSPSPLYSQKVNCTSSEHYATRHNGRSYTTADPAEDGHVWAQQPGRISNAESLRGKEVPILCSDKSKQCRKIDSNGSCRETNLGKMNPLNSVKSGMSLRRSSRGRLD